VPEISRFFGIVIAMFYADHSPPHFHARYGEHRVIIAIESLHRAGLQENWWRARRRLALVPIPPLE
jgi:hypothetical protein